MTFDEVQQEVRKVTKVLLSRPLLIPNDLGEIKPKSIVNDELSAFQH
jgi:hypothetical protein